MIKYIAVHTLVYTVVTIALFALAAYVGFVSVVSAEYACIFLPMGYAIGARNVFASLRDGQATAWDVVAKCVL